MRYEPRSTAMETEVTNSPSSSLEPIPFELRGRANFIRSSEKNSKSTVRTSSPTLRSTRVTNAALLPALPEIAAQMTGSEWLLSLSGTGEEKRLLTVNCNWCHSYQQIFRNRYDEHGWAQIVNRMTKGGGSPLLNMNPRGRFNDEDTAKLVKWLASVRGPDSKDPPFVTLPRPQGRQTRVVITEYELPRLELATHDVWGDSKGNIWYSPHRSSYIGRLAPRTRAVQEHRVPAVDAGVLPGTH